MKYIKYIALAGLVGLTSSCIDDLLNRPATTEVSSDLFWTSTDDALSSTYGVYNAVRTLFATDYYYDMIRRRFFIFRVLLSCHAMNFAEFLHFCLILLLKFRKREHLGG